MQSKLTIGTLNWNKYQNRNDFTWEQFLSLPFSCLLCSLYPCPVKLSNHYFIFAYPCSGSGNTKPSNKSRPNKWSRVNIPVCLNPHDSEWLRPTLHLLTWHYYMWCGDQGPHMGPWWPCGHMMICHDRVSSVSYYKRCNEQQTNVRSSNHVNQPFTQSLVMSWLWESGSTLTIPEFRNTFQIVSSQRQKRKAKKN